MRPAGVGCRSAAANSRSSLPPTDGRPPPPAGPPTSGTVRRPPPPVLRGPPGQWEVLWPGDRLDGEEVCPGQWHFVASPFSSIR